KTTSLTAQISATATAVPVASASGIAVNDVLLIDNEQMQVVSIAGNTLTVTRQFNSTSGVIHTNGSLVDVTTTLSAAMNETTHINAAIAELTHLSANITAVQTSFGVASATNIAVNDVLFIENEQVQVNSKSGN